jgi:hypothetical protein
MLLRIMPNLTQQDSELIFRVFDEDGDRIVSFLEFQNVINRYYDENMVPELKIDEAIKNLIEILDRQKIDEQVLF